MRALKILWKDKPYNYTKRARIFEGPGDWRLNLESADEHRSANLFFTDYAKMRAAYEAFIGGSKTIKQLLEENP